MKTSIHNSTTKANKAKIQKVKTSRVKHSIKRTMKADKPLKNSSQRKTFRASVQNLSKNSVEKSKINHKHLYGRTRSYQEKKKQESKNRPSSSLLNSSQYYRKGTKLADKAERRKTFEAGEIENLRKFWMKPFSQHKKTSSLSKCSPQSRSDKIQPSKTMDSKIFKTYKKKIEVILSIRSSYFLFLTIFLNLNF